MAELDPGDLRRQLVRKFGFTDIGGTRHQRFGLFVDDSMVAYADVPRHTAGIRDALIKNIASQVGVRGPQLRAMIQCQISKSGYLEILDHDPEAEVEPEP